MHVVPIPEVVRENLAAADPYYRGPHAGSDPAVSEKITPLDPRKTARDLGREDADTGESFGRRFDQSPSDQLPR